MLPIKGLQKTSLVDFPPHTVATIFLGNCNFRCPYCQNPDLILKFDEMPTISENEVIELLKSRKKWLEGVCLTGGEPLLYDLKEFFSKIKKLGMLIKLDTNGTNPEALKELIDKRLVNYVAMDIKSPLERYDEVAKVKVNKSDIQESVDILRNSGVDYEFRMTTLPKFHKESSIINIGKWLKGSKKFVIQQFRNNKPMIDQNFRDEAPYSIEELHKFKRMLVKYIDNVEIRNI